MLKALPKALADHKPLIISSGHALSKDYTMSGAMLWFCYCYSPCKVIFTAPTDRQVKGIMWAELERKWNKRTIELGGRLLVCQLDITPDWFILGFTTKETGGMVGKFQGFHAPSVMVLISEAQAVSDTIYDEVDGILTSHNSLLVMIGNPLRTTGRFAKSIKDKVNNIVIELSCLDSPNYKERKEVIPGMCSYQWVEDKRKRWGEQDPRWISKVLGKLPSTSIDTVWSQDIMDASVNRALREVILKKAVGMDIARYGDDDSVIYAMESGRVTDTVVKSKQEIDITASDSVKLQKKTDATIIAWDADGMGQGMYSHLSSMRGKETYELMEIHSNSTKDCDEDYQNLRAQMWFYAKEQARDGHLSIPDDEYLKEELLETKYFINHRGKIQLEDKDDVKDRLGRSPDKADAFVITVWALKRAKAIRKPSRWDSSPVREMDPMTA